MADKLTLAQSIRDIHMPEDVPFWPPAPGWWLVALVAVGCALAAAVYWRRVKAVRREALGQLNALQKRHREDDDTAGLAMGLSTLLRRVALARDSRRQVAGLCGEDWLAYLNGRGHTSEFTDGPGRVLGALPYSGSGEADAPALLSLVRHWIRLNT